MITTMLLETINNTLKKLIDCDLWLIDCDLWLPGLPSRTHRHVTYMYVSY